MKAKQIQTIKEQHNRYMHSITNPVKEPSEQCHIIHALVRGETVPQHNPKVISDAAREAIANCGYSSDRKLSFAQVFKAPASYDKAKRDYEAAERVRVERLRKYKKDADLLLLKAELNAEADAEEVSEQLRLLAIQHGIDA